MRSIVVLFALCACLRHAPTETESAKPRLVVLVVIDQWPSWVFEKQRHLFTGGIARLLREGAIVPAAELPYANTFTAPGHASIATGAPPRVHGIVGNSWWRRGDGKDRPAEFDPDSPPLFVGSPLGSEHVTPDDGASSRALRVDGVADVLRTATSGAGHSVAIALKARAACLVAGRRPDLAIWYEAGAGGMTTSKHYASAVPWLVELAHDDPPSRYFTETWLPRDPALLARETGVPDDAPGEQSDHGLGAAFPHALAANKAPAKAIVETPFADEMIAQTVLVALDAMQLGRDGVPDFLAVSFNAHDYAGHSWGPDSWEVLDLTLRLDTALGQLFDALDARVGKGNWAVIMTSDHGATPLLERGHLQGARRVPPQEIEQVVEQAVQPQLGPGPWVAKVVSNNIYLTAKFRDAPPDARDAALDAAAAALAKLPGIALSGRTDRFSADCSAERDPVRAVCLGTVPGEAGELYAYPAAGSVISDHKSGTAHDAPVEDNRRVPILIMAPGLKPQRGGGSLLQVAPTLAALLGIPPPPAAKEPTLFGIRRR